MESLACRAIQTSLFDILAPGFGGVFCLTAVGMGMVCSHVSGHISDLEEVSSRHWQTVPYTYVRWVGCLTSMGKRYMYVDSCMSSKRCMNIHELKRDELRLRPSTHITYPDFKVHPVSPAGYIVIASCLLIRPLMRSNSHSLQRVRRCNTPWG